MTPVELVTVLHKVGCRLILEGKQLRVQDPQHALNDVLRQAIREHKGELLRLLVQPTSAHEGPLEAGPILSQPAGSPPSSPHLANLGTSATSWRCSCCQGTRRWRSIYDVLVCGTCHPPGDDGLVAVWEDGR